MVMTWKHAMNQYSMLAKIITSNETSAAVILRVHRSSRLGLVRASLIEEIDLMTCMTIDRCFKTKSIS